MIKGQFCTMESHLIHSDAVFRVKGQECKGVNDQGSILYNGETWLGGVRGCSLISHVMFGKYGKTCFHSVHEGCTWRYTSCVVHLNCEGFQRTGHLFTPLWNTGLGWGGRVKYRNTIFLRKQAFWVKMNSVFVSCASLGLHWSRFCQN